MTDEAPGMYEAVTAHPEGSSTVARLAEVAADMDYDGLVIRNATRAIPDRPLEDIAGETGIDLVDGLELDPEVPDDASGRLPHLREQVTLLVVAGGSTRINRFVCQQERVDVLSRPLLPDGPYFEVGTAKAAISNDVAVEIDLSPLMLRGGTRVRYAKRLHQLWRIIEHYEVPYVVSLRPSSHLQLRGWRELRALGAVVGIDSDAVSAGLAEWGRIASRNGECVDGEDNSR